LARRAALHGPGGAAEWTAGEGDHLKAQGKLGLRVGRAIPLPLRGRSNVGAFASTGSAVPEAVPRHPWLQSFAPVGRGDRAKRERTPGADREIGVSKGDGAGL